MKCFEYNPSLIEEFVVCTTLNQSLCLIYISIYEKIGRESVLNTTIHTFVGNVEK